MSDPRPPALGHRAPPAPDSDAPMALSDPAADAGAVLAPHAVLDAPRIATGGTARPGIWQLAWPTIVANLLHSTVGFVDIKIVGSLGAPAVAAVTTGNRIFFVLMAVLMAVTAGTTALVARAWGADDRDEAERVTRSSAILACAIGLVFTAVGVAFADPIAGVFRLDAQTVALAATFIRWISLFSVPIALELTLGTALRAAGDVKTPLWVGAIANVINVALVYGLVFGELGLPRLGVQGAAIASGLAFAAAAVILGGLWGSGRLVLGVGPPRAFSRERARRLFHIGYPAGIEQGAWQLGFVAFLWIVALYGTEPYAAYGIGVNILAFSFVVGFGFSIAASTLVGQNLGAGDPEAATRSGWRGMRLAIGAMTLLGGAILLGARPLAEFMIDDPEVVRLTVVFIYVLGAAQPLMAIEFALGGALRGAGDTRFPLITILSGFFGVRILFAAIFAALDWPVEWVFAVLIGDYLVKASMLTWRFRSGRWQRAIS